MKILKVLGLRLNQPISDINSKTERYKCGEGNLSVHQKKILKMCYIKIIFRHPNSQTSSQSL